MLADPPYTGIDAATSMLIDRNRNIALVAEDVDEGGRVTLDAHTAPGLVQRRVLRVEMGSNVLLDGVRLTGGWMSFGAGVWNKGTLVVQRGEIDGNIGRLYYAGEYVFMHTFIYIYLCICICIGICICI